MKNNTNNKVMNIALWTVQVLLAIMFIMAGAMKSFQPIEKLSPMLPWVLDFPEILVRFIGISELLGGLGLILPSVLRILPVLTPIASSGLALIMVLSAIFHYTKGEFQAIVINVAIFVMTLFIAWGRAKKSPIVAK
jgi:putative oxidoreductase